MVDEPKPEVQAPVKPAKQDKSGKPTRAPIKMIILGCVVVLFFVIAVLVAGTVYAFTSNKSVPVFSSLVETTENLVSTDSQTAEVVQQDIKDTVFSLILDMRKGQTDRSMVQVSATEEEISSFIKNEQEFNSVRFEGTVESTSTSTTTVDFNGFFTPDGIQANFDGSYAMGDSNVVFGGEFRDVDGKGYFKVDELPTELLGIPEINALKGQWIVISTEDLADPTSLGSLGFNPTAMVASEPMTKADLSNIAEFIDSKEMADNIQRVDDEVIGGVRTNCFEMDMNANDLTTLVMKQAEISGEQLNREEVVESYQNYEQVLLTACSGREDKNLYKVNVAVTMNNSESGKTTTTVEIKLWDHNSVSDAIETPSSAMPISTVLQQLMPLFSGAPGPAGTVPTGSLNDNDWESYVPDSAK